MKPQRDEHGNLPAYAWPGGYPIYYVVADGGVLCPACANAQTAVQQADKEPDCPDYNQWRIIGADVNWEDNGLTCDHCNQRIESAYAEAEGGAQ